MKKYKSIFRALRRGHLKFKTKRIPNGMEHNPKTGIMETVFIDVPYLVRKTNKGNWIPY